jgi:hypothetical protein
MDGKTGAVPLYFCYCGRAQKAFEPNPATNQLAHCPRDTAIFRAIRHAGN